MEKLFNDKEVFTKKRPDFLLSGQMDKFLNYLANMMISLGLTESEPDEIVEDLSSFYPFNDSSGFEMAQELYSCGGDYNFGSELVSFMEDIPYMLQKEIDKNVEEWVKIYEIKPYFKIGDKIIGNDNNHESYIINEINEKLAMYTLKSVEKNCRTKIVKFENIHKNFHLSLD